MRGDWLSKKDKKEGGIIIKNIKKRDRVAFMKKREVNTTLPSMSHKKTIQKTYILNSFKLLRKRLEICNQIYINKNIMINRICEAFDFQHVSFSNQ